MHNIVFNKRASADVLKEVRIGVHKRKKDYLDTNEALLLQSHDNYNDLADAGKLNRLKPNYVNPGTRKEHRDDDYWISYDLYDSSLSYIAGRWNELIELNGGRSLICPLCGISNCKELDHFAPRSKFPEYSCHYHNLIPLCHECNNTKGDEWLNKVGEQIYFNAFYDTDLPEDVFKCIIVGNKDSSLLCVDINVSDSLQENNPQHERIKQTINRLGLLGRIKDCANEVFNRQIRDITTSYEVDCFRYNDMNDFLVSRMNFLSSIIQKKSYTNFVEEIVLKAIIESKLFSDFISVELSKIKK